MEFINKKFFLWTIIILLNHLRSYTQEINTTIEFQTGVVFNCKLPLIIKQDGYEDIYIPHAEYKTKPLSFPIYFDIRVSKWWNHKSLSIEMIHHKLYLQNCPPEIQSFSISHGYNMLFLNYGKRFN